MAIYANASSGGGFPPIEAGSYRAICYGIVVEGTFYNQMFGTTSTKIRFLWELPDERITVDGEDKPRAISEEYTLSLAERSNLRPMLESWRGKAFTDEELYGSETTPRFDIENVLKAPCLIVTTVGVSKKGKEFAKVVSVGKLPKGMVVPKETENPTIVFNVCGADCDLALMEQLPEWIQTRIKDSVEYKERTTSPDDFVEVSDEDLPFD